MTILSVENLLDQSTVTFKRREKTGIKMVFVWKGARSGYAFFDSRNGVLLHADPNLFWMWGMRLPRVTKLLRKRKLNAFVRDDIS